MVKATLVICALILSQAVLAVEVCWNPPTEREDGATLPESQIQGYVVQYTCMGSQWISSELVVNNCHVPVGIMGDCTFRVRAIDNNGINSAWSNGVAANVAAPNATGLRIGE